MVKNTYNTLNNKKSLVGKSETFYVFLTQEGLKWIYECSFYLTIRKETTNHKLNF